jgi:hypothetical protein
MRSLTPSIGVYEDSANKIGQGPVRRFLADVDSTGVAHALVLSKNSGELTMLAITSSS